MAESGWIPSEEIMYYMYPPKQNSLLRAVPFQARRCAKYVPGGTSVGMYHYSNHQSSKTFSDFNSFIPEGWIRGEHRDTKIDLKDPKASHPFSTGPRSCLGRG
jgi:cytochrome P450